MFEANILKRNMADPCSCAHEKNWEFPSGIPANGGDAITLLLVLSRFNLPEL